MPLIGGVDLGRHQLVFSIDGGYQRLVLERCAAGRRAVHRRLDRLSAGRSASRWALLPEVGARYTPTRNFMTEDSRLFHVGRRGRILALVEFLERLDADSDEERWLVQMPGASEPRVAWFFHADGMRLDEAQWETLLVSGLIHPRVSTIFQATIQGNRLLVEVDDDRGPTLARAAQVLTDPVERERWTVSQIIAIADGLATLRQRQADFVYRQLEPNRLFVDAQGHGRLRAPISRVVSGLRANRMGAGTVRGTFAFMSPEQVTGRPLGVASDVFALASNLVFALSGKKPFARETDFDQLKAIRDDPPAPIEIHAPGLRDVLARAFAKDPNERYPDPGTFAGELWRCVPDATEYDEVVSDRIVDLAVEPVRASPFTGPRCKLGWEQLSPTASPEMRHCSQCDQNVVRVRSLAQIVPLLGSCVAYTGGD